MATLSSSAGIAEAFVSGKCFEMGQGYEDMIYIKDALSGAYNNGVGWLQTVAGIGAFWFNRQSLRDDERVRDAVASVALSLAAFAADLTDYLGNTVVLIDKFDTIEEAFLGDGTLSDGSRTVMFFRGSFDEAGARVNLWSIVGICMGCMAA
ncbi:unnamed protein product [Prorocentrum cordatum]|uniref:H(+)-exporting diphosphatase n=1 Tax=Prorocentrum cordatum TaxID=2364126 RepID=A0ABN9TPH8_9DINO|nr:unnamed protein product [Polarella glacialis]